MSEQPTIEPCDDDGLETDGHPRVDEPMDPDPRHADYDTPPPDDFEPLPEDEPEEAS